MHTYYSNGAQNVIDCDYTTLVAEIASTTNEILLAKYQIENEKNSIKKAEIIYELLEMIRATLFRQSMFVEFEKQVHDTISSGKILSSEDLSTMYYELNKTYFGKDCYIDNEIRYEWARIPHFYTSFYVYKYATGLISALSIASDILNGNKEATDNYINKFLSAGGSDDPLNILKNANVDITSSKTINKAFCLFESKLNELESLVEKKCNNE
jgi:oligoendopeptidase F